MVTIVLNDEAPRVDLSSLTSYWIDPSTDTTLEQLVARASSGAELFKQSSSRNSHQAHGKVLWVRFELKFMDRNANWFLELANPLIDDVRLYWRDEKGSWQSLRAGDVVPRSQWSVQTRLPTFALALKAGQPVEYFLRISHRRAPVSFQLTALRDTELIASQQVQTLLLGAFFGLLLVVFMVSMVLAVLMRDRAFWAYSGYLLALGGFMFTNTGLSALYLWPNSPILADRMVFILACLSGATGPWFVRIIIKPIVRLRLLDSLIALMVITMLSVAILEIFYPTRIGFLIVNLGVALALFLIYGLVLSAWQRGDAATRWVALGFLPVTLGAAPLLLRNMGLISNGDLAQYSILLGAALEMPILLYALLSRSSQRRDSQMRAVGLPKQDALTRLPNLRILIEQLHGALSRARRYGHTYGLVMVELANEAWFAKEYGRDMADRALILLAARLEQLSREVDTVSRIDSTYFTVLIEGPCDSRMMAKLATRISACGLKPNEVLPVGAVLKLKITCALMPHAQSLEIGDDANAQLGWLIGQADALPYDPRKTVHTLGF